MCIAVFIDEEAFTSSSLWWLLGTERPSLSPVRVSDVLSVFYWYSCSTLLFSSFFGWKFSSWMYTSLVLQSQSGCQQPSVCFPEDGDIHWNFCGFCPILVDSNPLQWVLAWSIPGTVEPGGLPSMGSHRVGHDWSNLAAAAAVDSGLISAHTHQPSAKAHSWCPQGA